MDRPFLTFNQQIDKLRNEYKLIILDYDFAIEALSSVSYYDLINGYQSIYMQNKEYIQGTSMEQLYSTHIFNKNIQGVLLKYSTYVENSFKTMLAYIIAESFGEHQDNYLKISNYRKGRYLEERNKLKALINKLIDMCNTCDDTPTKHYRETKDHIPPWILFRNISFSDATDLFKFLYPTQKEQLFLYSKILNTDKLNHQNQVDISISALNLVRKYRNKMAHNLNFLTYRGSSLNKKANILFINSLITEKESNFTRSDIWALVISIVILLNNKYLIHDFLAELNSYMKYDEHLAKIYCKVTGIPIDYEKRIKAYLDKLI